MVIEMDRQKCGDCGAFVLNKGEEGLKGIGVCSDYKISGVYETHKNSYAAIINRFRRQTCFRSYFNPKLTIIDYYKNLATNK